MSDLSLYWCPQTRASRAVWMLEEAGATYSLIEIDVQSDEAKADPQFRAASPMGKVPALRDGDVTLTDSAAICMYVADKFPEAGLAPELTDPDRASYYQWMVFTPGCIEPGMAEAFGSTKPNKVSHGWGDFPAVIEMLTGGLKGKKWILGDTFTAADVMLGSSVQFMRMFGVLPENDVLTKYADRCLERPAYQKALKLDAEAATA